MAGSGTRYSLAIHSSPVPYPDLVAQADIPMVSSTAKNPNVSRCNGKYILSPPSVFRSTGRLPEVFGKGDSLDRFICGPHRFQRRPMQDYH